jgi:phosphoribosyl 1,2-cyclic phosphodiesterase
MAQFCALASSSAGNSAYISCGAGAVLIDAGISCRRIFASLDAIGVCAQNIQAVLITHEHIDHIRGLCRFVKKTNAAVYATAPVLALLESGGHLPIGAALFEVQAQQPFEVAGMQATAFFTPHDSVGSVGYRIAMPGGTTAAVATDLGEVTDEVACALRGCDLVMLESNYDPHLLRMGPYPYYIKQRIASARGHLSNQSSADFAQLLVETGTTRLVLAHLSRENNHPALAHQTVDGALRLAGGVCGIDYELAVAPYDAPGKLVRF